MLRIVIIALALAFSACSNPSKVDESRATGNIVCERIAEVDKNAKCVPELTDVGEHHTHRARVTQDKGPVSCFITDEQISVACGHLFVVPHQKAEAAAAVGASASSTTATATKPEAKKK